MSDGAFLERFFVLQDLTPPDAARVFSRTFLAVYRPEMREVALTLPRSDLLGALEVFVSQIERLTTAHPGRGPRLIAGGQDGARPYLAAGFVHGVHLRDALDADRLTTEVALLILAELAEQLAELHAAGFVHGDLHPRNVRVDPAGGVRLVGFAPAPFGAPTTTRPPAAPLRRYASPAVLAGARAGPVDDVYGLGLIAYELFTGRPLLPRADVPQTRRNQEEVQKALRKVVRVTRTIPLELSAVIRAMIDHDPAVRPADGGAVREALAELTPETDERDFLREELAESLRRVYRREIGRLVQAGEAALADEDLVRAAAATHRAGRLSGCLTPSEKAVVGRLLFAAATRAFPAGLGDDPGLARFREAVLLQLWRGAAALGEERVAGLLGRRLRGLLGDAVADPLGIPPEDEGDAGLEGVLRARLAGRVEGGGLSEEELLTLALLTPGFRTPEDPTTGGLHLALAEVYRRGSLGPGAPRTSPPPAKVRGTPEAATSPPPRPSAGAAVGPGQGRRRAAPRGHPRGNRRGLERPRRPGLPLRGGPRGGGRGRGRELARGAARRPPAAVMRMHRLTSAPTPLECWQEKEEKRHNDVRSQGSHRNPDERHSVFLSRLPAGKRGRGPRRRPAPA